LKISVGIPTIAGRQKYLASTLKTCVTQEGVDLEIVVSDNSEGDAREVVAGIGDPRVRYIRPDGYLPMSAHWDFLTSHFTGDLVTIIGDDDGLMPGALRRVHALVDVHGLQPIVHALAQYGWPDVPDPAAQGKCWFWHAPGGPARQVPSVDFLRQLCGGRIRYADGPAVYHNFIPRAVLEGLRRDGVLFHRSSPDIYSAITIAAHTESYLVTGEVLTVSGVSARSNGASMRDGRADGRRSEQEMRAERYRPRYASLTVQLHVLDSILEASERYGRPELKEWIHYGEHFCGGANECLDMPNRRRGLQQMLLLLKEASKSGCLGYLLRNRGAKLVEVAGARLFPRRRAETSGASWSAGVRMAVPAQVDDVYSASLFLRELLP
jgi:hypothetical protein